MVLELKDVDFIVSLMEQYKAHLAKQAKSDNTIVIYTTRINRALREGGNIDRRDNLDMPKEVIDIASIVVEHTYSFLERRDILRKNALNQEVSVTRSFLKFLQLKYGITSPVIEYRMEPELKKDIQVIDNNQFEIFLNLLSKDTFQTARDRAILRSSFNSGLSLEEVAHITYSDFKLSADEPTQLWIPKSAGGRLVYLDDLTQGEIGNYMDIANKTKLKNPIDTQGTGFYRGETGDKITTRSIRRALKKYINQANIPNISPTNLRHSYIKNAIECGVPIETISKQTGVSVEGLMKSIPHLKYVNLF